MESKLNPRSFWWKKSSSVLWVSRCGICGKILLFFRLENLSRVFTLEFDSFRFNSWSSIKRSQKWLKKFLRLKFKIWNLTDSGSEFFDPGPGRSKRFVEVRKDLCILEKFAELAFLETPKAIEFKAEMQSSCISITWQKERTICFNELSEHNQDDPLGMASCVAKVIPQNVGRNAAEGSLLGHEGTVVGQTRLNCK